MSEYIINNPLKVLWAISLLCLLACNLRSIKCILISILGLIIIYVALQVLFGIGAISLVIRYGIPLMSIICVCITIPELRE